MKILNAASSVMLAFFVAQPVVAQSQLNLDVEDAVETTPDTGQSQVSAEAAQAAQAAQSAAQPAAPVAARAVRARRQASVPGFVLRDIRFTGTSSYVTAAQLSAAEERLRGVRLGSARDVARVGLVLTDALYGRQGLTTAQAVIRDVNVRTGVVTVELLEARIGQVRYRSNILSDKYLRYRLSLPEGGLADNREIDAQLQQFQLTDGIALGSGFSPGKNFGETDVTISAPDIPRFSTVITLDNYGAPAAGEAQMTISHVIQSVTGWNDPVSLSYSQREGSKALSLGYSRIVSKRGARLSFAVSGSESETLGAFPVTGSRRDASAALSVPVVLKSNQRTNVSLAVAGFRESSDFLGFRILDQTGREASIGVTDFRRGDAYTLSTSAALTYGRYDNGVTGQTGVSYSYLSGSLSYARTVSADLFASVQVGAQSKLGGAIPSSRLFTVTSPSAVRGYPTSLSSGSEGYYARLQLEKSTPYALGGKAFGIRPFAFFDIGEARDSTGARLGLAQSVGVGTSFTSGKAVFGDIFVAKPLNTNITGWATPSSDPMIGGSISIRF